LAVLDRFGIRYLIVGGIAVGVYTEPRFTKDLDVLVAVSPPEHHALYAALTEFGAPVHLVRPEDFAQEDFVFHFGSPPWRIDILTSVPGVDFGEAYADRVMAPLGGISVSFISREWLIRAKRASGRHQDLADLEKLEADTG
jgi:hypothetical protein